MTVEAPLRPLLPLAEEAQGRPRAARHRVHAAVVATYVLAAAAATAANDALPVPTWLALHLLLLGAATNAVMVWSRHFAQALLHARRGSEGGAHARLVVLNAGALAVLAGITGPSAPAVVTGAALVGLAVVAHGASLVVMLRRSRLAGRLRDCVRYYVASAGFLALGATAGAVLGTGAVHATGVHLAHAHANLLGWLGLAVLGTQAMLWPAVLRTRMADDAPRVARRVLPLCAGGLLVAAGALAVVPGSLGTRVAATGVMVYLVGVVLSLRPELTIARRRAPREAAPWLLAAGTAWFLVALGVDVVALARGPQAAVGALELVVPLLALGFVGQVLTGALVFLLPVTLGGGPAGNRRLTRLLSTGWVARLAVSNAGLVALTAGPSGGSLRRAGTALAVVALASAAPLVLSAVVLSRRAPAAGDPLPEDTAPVRDWTEHVAVGSVLAVVAVLAVVVVPAPAAPAGPVAGARTVAVALTEFGVQPARVEVLAGTRLLLEVRNDGAVPHDLRFAGARTPVLRPGGTASLDLGVVTASQEGWCTLAGHRAAGMTMTVAVGSAAAGAVAAPADDGHAHAHGDAAGPASAPDWQPYDAALAPAPGGREHRVTLRVLEQEVEVAPGVRQPMWTFGGTVPGPALRGRVGDLFTVTLVNDGTIAHSLDLHASAVAPDRLMRPVPPGGSLVYSFRAERAGAWLYHCSADPMIQHVGMGMYGAVVIDPPDLAPVDEELLLVQSEVWLAEDGELPAVTRMTDADDDLVVFNGAADQYARAPVRVRAGDRVRIWVVAAGPSQSSAFHVVGTQFDTVYEEGRYALRPDDPGGAQVVDVPPGAGGFAELVVPEAGTYPMVSHRLADAARGATGLLVADPA